jgi:hypothetical protein
LPEEKTIGDALIKFRKIVAHVLYFFGCFNRNARLKPVKITVSRLGTFGSVWAQKGMKKIVIIVVMLY